MEFPALVDRSGSNLKTGFLNIFLVKRHIRISFLLLSFLE